MQVYIHNVFIVSFVLFHGLVHVVFFLAHNNLYTYICYEVCKDVHPNEPKSGVPFEDGLVCIDKRFKKPL